MECYYETLPVRPIAIAKVRAFSVGLECLASTESILYFPCQSGSEALIQVENRTERIQSGESFTSLFENKTFRHDTCVKIFLDSGLAVSCLNCKLIQRTGNSGTECNNYK